MKKILVALGVLVLLPLAGCAAPSEYDQAYANCVSFMKSLPEEWLENRPLTPEEECDAEVKDRGENFTEFWTDEAQFGPYQDDLREFVENNINARN